MYVIGSEQCNLPNSESPITQQMIAAENAFGNSVGSAFVEGDATLNNLITALGGNPGGDTVSGAAGVPTTGTVSTAAASTPVVSQPTSTPSTAILPSINDPSFWAWGSSPPSAGHAVPSRVVRGGRRQAGKNAARYGNVPAQTPQNQNPPSGCPVVVPLVTAIPIPQTATTPAATPAAAAPAATPAGTCPTGNICLDLMNGCILSSQVDPRQLQACSAAGYVGNKNLFPAIAAKGGADNGAYQGFPDPNPTPYTPGMSGFGQDDSATQAANASLFSNVFEGVISALAAAAALGILLKRKS